MLLDVAGEPYTAHFSHFQDERLRWETRCVFHAGRCSERGCAARFADSALGVGVAVTNPIDQFSKSKGRILSLTRALSCVPRPIREQIWRAYFAVVPHK